MTKILAAGDIHGDTSLAKKLAEKAEKEKVDLLVLCGDITDFDKSTDNLIGPFVKKKQKVLLIPGNHEGLATADFFAEMYGATNLHGYSFKLKNLGLFGCGFANLGLTRLNELEIFNILKKGDKSLKGSKTKIMVTHVHPAGSKIDKFSKTAGIVHLPGSTGVEKAIKTLKPDILLCSHVHEAEGIEEKIGFTRVINVGKKGKIIII